MAVCLRCAALPTTRSAAANFERINSVVVSQGLRKGIAGGSLGIRGRQLSSLRAVSVPAAALHFPSWVPPCKSAGRRSSTTAGVSQQEQAAPGATETQEVRPSMQDPRVPVTIITGFLGSGKVCWQLFSVS